jgi:hypothetical protein
MSFMPHWSPMYFFFLFFEISSPMWPKRGFWYHICLTLQITLLSKILVENMLKKHQVYNMAYVKDFMACWYGIPIISYHQVIHLLLQLDFGIMWHFNGCVILHAKKLKDLLEYFIWFNFFPLPCLRRNCNLQDVISFQTFNNAPLSLA